MFNQIRVPLFLCLYFFERNKIKNPVQRVKLFFLQIAPILLITAALTAASVPWSIGFIIAIAISIWHAKISNEPHATIMVGCSLLLVMAILECSLRLTQNRPTYYRPDERLAVSEHLCYKPNSTVENFKQPFGDLYGISNYTASSVIEPRTVTYRIDSLGYRNDRPFREGDLVIVGDSFIVGTGVTQEETLANRLSKKLGRGVYSLSFPGDPPNYVSLLEQFTEKTGSKCKAVFFFFEGNDFEDESIKTPKKPFLFYDPYEFRILESYRFLFGLSRRAIHNYSSGKRQHDSVIWRLGGKDMAFYQKYISQVESPKRGNWDNITRAFRRIQDRVELIVFIPDKYRVYHSMIPEVAARPLPNAQLSFVCEMAAELGNPPILDLTNPMVKASENLLKEGRHTFWRDDTHWNGEGIAVAAQSLAEYFGTKN